MATAAAGGGGGGGATGPSPQQRCPKCKQRPPTKEGTCALCLSKAYCSPAGLQAGRKHHFRVECPRLAFEYFMSHEESTMQVSKAMMQRERHGEAEEYLTRLVAVGEQALKHQGSKDELTELVNRVGPLILQAAEAAKRQVAYERAESYVHKVLSVCGHPLVVPNVRLYLRLLSNFRLGLVRTGQQRFVEAEALLRKAMDLGEELLSRVETGVELVESAMDKVFPALAQVLDKQGRHAEAKELYETEVLPIYVSQVLGGGSRATQAQANAFDMAAALQVPLPGVGAAICLWQWCVGMRQAGRCTRRESLPVIMRARQRLVEIERPASPSGLLILRALLCHDADLLDLPQVLSLYREQQGMPRPQDDAIGLDASSVSGHIGQGIEFMERAVAEARALRHAHPNLFLRVGDCGKALVLRDRPVDAERKFEEAIELAQAVLGEELIGAGINPQNRFWLADYLKLLMSKPAEEQSEDTRACIRWLRLLYAELAAKEKEITDEMLDEIGVAMRRSRVARGEGEDLSRRARQRLEARRRAAEARRLKRERERARARAEAEEVAAAASEAPRIDEEEEEEEEAAAPSQGKGSEEEEAEAEVEEYSVCLIEFEDGEEGREVLACTHAYHARCLDAWSDMCRAKKVIQTCPMCRQRM